MSDQTLKTRIEKVLDDSTTRLQALTVDVDAGEVTVAGLTDSFQSKLAAEELISSVPGVQQVINQITVEFPPIQADRDLEESLRQVLTDHPEVPKAAILVRARAGRVTLTGEVATARERSVTGDVAQGVPGVHSVENLLVVDWINMSGDEALASIIQANILSRSGLKSEDIRVAVTGNTVRLSGQVNASWKKIAAGILADRYQGLQIDNQIRIVPQSDR